MRTIIWLSLGAILMVACAKTQPQRPSFRGEQTADSTVVHLLSMNRQLASQADLQLADIATPEYVLMEENYWVKGLYPLRENELTLQEGEYVQLEAQFFSLTNELLTTHQASVKLGQVDDIQALALVLPLMQHGSHISMLVPWYMAFGSAGNQDIPPYENLRVELSVQ